MLALLAAVALASSTALLRVGIHIDAGDIRDVAADGAAGQCTSGPSWIACPADGPVTFRWGHRGDDWVLAGQNVVGPDEEGVAYVWIRDEARADDLARLSPEGVTGAAVREVFLDDTRPPSAALVAALLDAADHPDPEVRRAFVEAIQPLCGRSILGPLPPTAPVPLSADLLVRLGEDPDAGVRRRVAVMLRDLRPSPLDAVVPDLLTRLARDRSAPVRRAALASLASVTGMGVVEAEDAWREAMAAVPQEGGPGRMAINTLARLAQYTEPSEVIDPAAAVALALEHHPERAWRLWTAWREEVPFRRDWADTLLRGTVGYSTSLLQHWQRTAPDDLAAAMTSWEPVEPHSERWQSIAAVIAAADRPVDAGPPEE